MPIKSKVLIQTLQKSQDRHQISSAFEFNNKHTKKIFVIQLDFRKSQETVFTALRTKGKKHGKRGGNGQIFYLLSQF